MIKIEAIDEYMFVIKCSVCNSNLKFLSIIPDRVEVDICDTCIRTGKCGFYISFERIKGNK